MDSCPNIAGNQVGYRKKSGYFSLVAVIVFTIVVSFYDFGVFAGNRDVDFAFGGFQ